MDKKTIDTANSLSIELHSRLMDQEIDEHRIVSQNERSHALRFSKIMELGDFNGKSILDVGCGLGAFYNLIKEKCIEADYFGIDINPRMIEKCKEKYPEIANHFLVHDIIVEDFVKKFDYIIVVGLINLDFGVNINNVMTEQLINQIHKHANIGYAVSMTSSLTRNPSTESYYYKPQEIISIISGICNNFKLDHTYMPHDFTVFCYKDDFYSNYSSRIDNKSDKSS